MDPSWLNLNVAKEMNVWNSIRISLLMLTLMTVVTGGLYPLSVLVLAQICFPHQANGSLVVEDDRVLGSEWIGQSFSDPRFFWGRPSATSPVGYNAAASSGSNLGPLNPALVEAVEQRVAHWRAHGVTGEVPVDLVTSSASGLDPHISWAAADVQVARVAQARNVPEAEVRAIVVRHREGRVAGIWGEPRVNVLRLNLALSELRGQNL